MRRLASAHGSATLVPAAVGMFVAIAVLLMYGLAVLAMHGWPDGWGVPTMPAGMGGGARGHMGMMNGGADTSGAAPTVGSHSERIIIRDFAFSPGNLQVPVGATVVWRNEDSAPHDATSRDGTWNTRLLSQGDSESITFDSPGAYEYYCSVHPDMIARLTVRG